MSTKPIGVITSMPASSVCVPMNNPTEPLDNFFRALMRHHDFCMKQKATEAISANRAKETQHHERPNAKRPHDSQQ